MTEITYEDECMRAELLGIDKPDYEEFMKNKKEKEEYLEETVNTENLKEFEHQNETTGGISTGLDELNNILQGTQKKLNKFRASCGGITNLLKIKIGRNPADQSNDKDINEGVSQNNDKDELFSSNESNDISNNFESSKTNKDNGTPIRKSDLDRALDNNLDQLDLLNEKAERAHISMSEQTKQMKSYLNLGFFGFGGQKSN